jgi:hypothetical protein
MASKCFSLVRGRAMRVTKLDGCGFPVPGPDAVVVTDGFITVGLTANTDEGTEINVTNAAGKVCILDSPAPKFTGYDVTVEFCQVDPALFSLMTGQEVVMDAATPTPNAVGFKMNTDVDADESGFALELWSNVPATVCEAGQGTLYGYFLIPFLKGGVLGDFTIGNDAVNFTLSGANSKDGNGWDEGPYDVVPDAANLPGPLLDPLDPNDHLLMQLTTVAPPDTETCGAQALGAAATTATAGTPGTYSVAGGGAAYGPATPPPPSPVGLTASPTTAWSAGQYVVTRDGGTMHWSGTAWVAGVG